MRWEQAGRETNSEWIKKRGETRVWRKETMKGLCAIEAQVGIKIKRETTMWRETTDEIQ